jgi:hypothetical protein
MRSIRGGNSVLLLRQAALVVGAALAYFGVRGLTEGAVARADRNADLVLQLERSIGLDQEQELQDLVLDHEVWVTVANWVYIWLHWPVIALTLLWLLFAHRRDYFELRNAIFISGAIGLVIFATFPVTPPRLFGLDYVDTVTERSNSYRVLQPPSLVNKYAAVPSLHFGWNLIVGITWWRVGRTLPWRIAAVAMPIAMGWAVVATANHWVTDVVIGGTIALTGLAIERAWVLRRRRTLAGLRLRRADRAPTGQTPGAEDAAETEPNDAREVPSVDRSPPTDRSPPVEPTTQSAEQRRDGWTNAT